MIDKMNESSYRKDLRERIIIKACDSFRKNGIKKVTMDEIAASLGISKRTLYEIYKDKETLLIEIILYNREKDRVLIEQICKESTNVLEIILHYLSESIKFLQNTNKQLFSDLKKYPKAYSVLIENKEKESKQKIEFYKSGVDQGLFREDVNFEILTLLVEEQFDLLLNTDICGAYSFVEVFESIFFTFIRGIATEKGAKVLEDFLKEYRKQNVA